MDLSMTSLLLLLLAVNNEFDLGFFLGSGEKGFILQGGGLSGVFGI
jgi:hypothetical protein